MDHIVGPAYLKGPPGTPYGGALIGNVGNTSTSLWRGHWTIAVISGNNDVLLQKSCCAENVASVISTESGRLYCGADEQGAQNPIAYDDDVAARLYDETGRILSAKISAFDGGRQWA